MGKEWLYKVGGGGDGGGKSSSTASIKAKNRRTRERNTWSSGCMSAIFNLFDIQHHQFHFRHPSLISESSINIPQESNHMLHGVGASRSSLKSPQSTMDDVASSSSKAKEQTNFNIPMGGIQIKTKRSRFTDDVSSECSSSPGIKTPSLVARLMGLDLLPEISSPRPSSSSTPVNHHHHSRSLPASPRISTASRLSTEIDYHHRLSLQIDKENYNNCAGQEHESVQVKMARRRRSELLANRREVEITSQYATQIAKQVKEKTSRRVGADITNTMAPTTRNKEQRRDLNLVSRKPKRPPPNTKEDTSTPFSSSRKLILLEMKNNLDKPISNSESKEVESKRNKPPRETPLMKQEKLVKLKRIAGERYEMGLKKNAFLKKKKSTPLPNLKKEMTSSSSTARLPQKQVSLGSMTQLRSSQNRPYNLHHSVHDKLDLQDDCLNAPTTSAAKGGPFSDHYHYISRILNHSGIHSATPISIAQWYSPSHPLHPSLFHQLEKLSHPAATATSGRRLLFELVDECLAEILKPYMSLKPTVPDSYGMCGSDLVGKLCKMIGSINPAVDCRVLEDIDGLVEGDMRRSIRRLGWTALEEEAEEIVREMEVEIVEKLVHEMATLTVDSGSV